MTNTAILRLRQVKEKVGLSRATIYRLVAANRFPLPVPLAKRATGWVSDEIETWLTERVRLRSARGRKRNT